MAGVGLAWDLLAHDQASPAFLRVAGAADKAATSTARASAGMSASMARMGKTGATLTKRLTLPIAAIGAVSIEQAAKFQKSMNTIRVATDRTTAQMAAGNKGLLQIAKSTGTEVGRLSDSFYVASKSGLSVAKSLAVTKAAAQAAKVENADLATVTSALTSVMASYGRKLGNPVRAMNEIIKGAALAKTTTQDFSASLSNVVPVASSLGISFDQVAGAIATMTQHGETAQRATDNLSNLITNLAGQNNVASQALQQLGVNTISLSRHLGRRGLVGSLNDVLTAVRKHSHDGLIVTSAFKQAATATRSLRTEIDSLPKSMQANAKAFIAGRMSYKEFNAYAKSLGGQQYQLAKGLLLTAGQALGFNNQLKSGNSNVRTLASTLQKALGGVTGMRVALMLSGTSAAAFARSTNEVRKAADASKGDVLGWANTQGLLSTKMDKAKAALQVLAIEIGTALIPAVSKIVGWVSKAVHWFENLSGTQKKVLAWSAGVLAAFGPLLSIGSRLALVGRGIGRFIGGVSTRLASLAGVTTEEGARFSAAMKGIGAAAGGAGIGIAFGTLTQNSSTATKAVGALAAAATGAAIGFGIGGPWGAAIGGGIGLLSDLATAFTGSGDSARRSALIAQQAMADEKQSVDTLLTSLQSVNGQYNQLAKNQVISRLQSKGILSKGQELGVNPADIANYALGKQGSINRILDQMHQYAAAHSTVSNKAQDDFLKTLDQVTGEAGQAEKAYELYVKAQGRGIVPTKLLAGGTKNLAKELQSTGTALDIVGSAYENTSAFAIRNTEIIRENIASLKRKERAEILSGVSAKKAAGDYQANIAALRAQLVQLGFNKVQIAALFALYARPPKPPSLTARIDALRAKIKEARDRIDSLKQSHKPGVDAEIAKLRLAIQSAQATINSLRGKTVPVNADTSAAVSAVSSFASWYSGVISRLSSLSPSVPTPKLPRAPKPAAGPAYGGPGSNLGSGGKPPHAAGGSVRDGYFTSGERGWELGYKHGPNVTFFDNKTSQKMTGWNRVPGFAAGTNDSQRIATLIGNVGSQSTKQIDVASVGWMRIAAQLRKARIALDGAHLSAKAKRRFKQELAALTHEAFAQLRDLRVKIHGPDLAALRRALKGTVTDVRAAGAQLLTDLRMAGATAAQIARTRAQESRLYAGQQRLDSARNRLSTIKDYNSGIKSTLTGTFDPGQYGSVTDLLAGLGGQTTQNRAYAGQLNGLRRRAKGNRGLTAFINQLAASGETTTLQSLAGASKSDLANVTKGLGAYNASVQAGADAASMARYGTTQGSAQAVVDKLAEKQDKVTDAIVELAKAVGGSQQELAKAVGGHADKRIERALHDLRIAKQLGRKR